MAKRAASTPALPETRPPLPDFAPVPRRYRHDGWTPERQRAFIEALADTGCVERAARMVNIASANAYVLRRAVGAEAFRRAWDAALDLGVKRLKDIAFTRAIEGELVPVFAGGKLMGYRRKYNDALLMFCLRHYGQDAEGRRTTINYVSTRASASAGACTEAGVGVVGGLAGGVAGRAGADGLVAGGVVAGGALVTGGAQLSTTTLRTVITGAGGGGVRDAGAARDDAAAALVDGFAGVTLDPEAQAQIMAALEACAARAREAEDARGPAALVAGLDDLDEPFVPVGPMDNPYTPVAHQGGMVSPVVMDDADARSFGVEEAHWSLAGAEMPDWGVVGEGDLDPLPSSRVQTRHVTRLKEGPAA